MSEEGHSLRFLGIEIDTKAMGAGLLCNKHKKAMPLLKCTLLKYSVTQRCLPITIGFSSFASKLILASHICHR